jgi:hypothetical protein
VQESAPVPADCGKLAHPLCPSRRSIGSALQIERFAMTVASEDRPIETVRRETIDQLILNYGHGKLSLAAFERRLDTALEAQSHAALLELTKDLEVFTDPGYAGKKQAELGVRVADNVDDVDEEEYMVHVFGGSNRKGTWNVAPRIKMINVFGGCDLDFTEATFTARKTRIIMLCLFGGATLYVPEGVRAISKAVCIFGGINNRAPGATDPNAPTLVIEGIVLFGGVDIKLKKSFKKRYVEFAQSIRGMLGST